MPSPLGPLVDVSGSDLTGRQMHDILRLRVDIFVVEQNCPYHEIDGRDVEADTRHLWVADDVGVASYIRILTDPANGADARKIGRVVTRADRRGEQLGARLIAAALEQFGSVDTRLEAQSHLVGYYRRFGYEPDGPEYVEDGIPHTPMFRPADLASPAS